MKTLITGGTGFVGRRLAEFLTAAGYEVTVVARNPRPDAHSSGNVRFVAADTMKTGPWMDEVAESRFVINLTGASIFDRWTTERKRLIHDSRILTTMHIVEALPESAEHVTLLSTSGVGYYGFSEDIAFNEDAPAGTGFLADLSQDWEAEALKARQKGARVALMRFGVVFGPNGGALKQMALPFRFFVGGPAGSGEQWVSWIHLEDLVRAAQFCMENTTINGPVNFTAPAPVQNRDLASAVGAALHRPAFFKVPRVMLELMFGEMASVVVQGQRVVPEKLVRAGFEFLFSDSTSAVRDILSGHAPD